MNANRPSTKSPSIRVLTGDEGQLLWEIGFHAATPSRVPLTVDEARWQGYVFWLSYVHGDLIDLRVTRSTDAPPLTAQALQRVPLGALDRAARQCVESFLEEWTRLNPQRLQSLYPDPLDWLDDIADAKPADAKQDINLAKLCRRYLELAGEPDWRETLSVEFNYSPSSVQTIIARARKRRFLTPVSRGQQGGQLTPKALRLLAPPEMRTAWERATEEQRQATLQRDDLESRLSADLHRQWQQGEIDKRTHAARTHAITAYVYGWEPRELDLDPALLADVKRELQTMKEQEL